MRPRNKYEREVAKVNATLKEDISAKDYEWAKGLAEQYCSSRLPYVYFCLTTEKKEFAIHRIYRIYKYGRSKKFRQYYCVEIGREFHDVRNDKVLYFSKRRKMGFYFDTFTFSSAIELRGTEPNFAGNDITMLKEYCCQETKEQTRGKRVPCVQLNPKDIAHIVSNYPVAETMYKEQDPMFYYIIYHSHVPDVLRAYTIAKRHGFNFCQMTIPLWLDLFDAVHTLGLDWHNPHYICPQGYMELNDMHNIYVERLARRRERQAREWAAEERARNERMVAEKLAREEKYGKMYDEQRRRFFDMVLRSRNKMLEIRPLTSIEDFKEEARLMKHCVYRMEYWNMETHPNSLILSASVNGYKMETIEVNIKTYRIAQCYGEYDKFTQYHDMIMRFVERKMNIIRQYNEQESRQAAA